MFEAMRRYGNRASSEGEPSASGSPQSSFTGKLAGWTARHALITLAIWVVVLVGAFLLAGNLSVSGEGGVESTDARRAANLIEEATGAEPAAEEFVLIESNDGPIDEALLEAVVGSIATDMRELPMVVEVSSYLDGVSEFRA
nr:hypothetical protein [Chloroflexota bacterium]